jgi:hypothetical protein
VLTIWPSSSSVPTPMTSQRKLYLTLHLI